MPQTRHHIQPSYSQQRQRHSQAGDAGVRLTRDGIECFMTVCQAEGRVEGTLKWYRRGLNRLYDDLPEDKTIRHGTLERWREQLVKAGYAPSTINSYLSVNNAYLDFVGHREYQLANQLKLETELQPELTRTEYLRLLQTARIAENRRAYLLIKLFGTVPLSANDLGAVTVEAMRTGHLQVFCGKTPELLYVPAALAQELLTYAQEHGIHEGAIFRSRVGTLYSRSRVTLEMQKIAGDARISPEKATPRALKKLCRRTMDDINANLRVLAIQNYEALLGNEQQVIGWKDGV